VKNVLNENSGLNHYVITAGNKKYPIIGEIHSFHFTIEYLLAVNNY